MATSDGFSDLLHCVFVDNLPIVPQEKLEKLKQAVLSKFLRGVDIINIELPFNDEKRMSEGCAFVEFEKPEAARVAIKKLDGQMFGGKKMSFIAFTDIDSFLETPDEAPTKEMLEDQVDVEKPDDLYAHLTDEDGRDQFMLLYKAGCHLFWSQGMEKYPPKRITELPSNFPVWSSFGAYLATMYSNDKTQTSGVKLYSGERFRTEACFPHDGIKMFAFSPSDAYLVSMSITSRTLRLSHVPTATQLCEYDVSPMELERRRWPVFEWSGNGKFFSRMPVRDKIVIYRPDLNASVLLEDGLSRNKFSVRQLNIPRLQTMCWSPCPNSAILAYWIPEERNSPARVTLLDVATNTILTTRNLVNVRTLSMEWHPKGDYLMVKVIRQPSKKTFTTRFEIFRLREEGCPVEIVDMDKEPGIKGFNFSCGDYFSIAYGTNLSKITVDIYDLKENGKVKMAKAVSLVNRGVNHICWNPEIPHVVVLCNFNTATLEFYDVSRQTTTGRSEVMILTAVNWDPSGRTLAAYAHVTDPKSKMANETGFGLFTFQGKVLFKQQADSVRQLQWRPRPRALLSEEETGAVTDDLRSYVKKYQAQDKQEELERRRDQLRARAMTLMRFQKKMAELQRWRRRKLEE